MIKAVIFDMDGVIADSEPVNIEAGVVAFKEIGIDLTEQDKKEIVGRHPVDYNNVLANKYKFDKDNILKKEREHYFEVYDEKVTPIERTINLAKELKKKGFKVGLATASQMQSVNIVLDKFNLREIFDSISTFDDCSERKPAPDIYLLSAKKLEVNPDECIAFEDTSLGVASAKNAGMKCVALPNRFTKDMDFSRADAVIDVNQELKLEIVSSV